MEKGFTINSKDNVYYIGKIIDNIDFAISVVENYSLQEFENNQVLVNAVMFSFVQIAEYSLHLDEEFRNENKNIPWIQVKGIRNKIVHDYDIVENYIVYDTAKNDLPLI